jgi:hypothetical protein
MEKKIEKIAYEWNRFTLVYDLESHATIVYKWMLFFAALKI